MRTKRLIYDCGKYHVDKYGRTIRRVRDLKTGRWYNYWYTLDYGRTMQEVGFSMDNIHKMATAKVAKKRGKSLLAYYKKNPNELARRIRAAMHNNPSMQKRFVRWFYKTLIWKFFHADDVTKEEVAAVVRSSKEGRQILEYVECQRKQIYKGEEVQTGVVHADRL